MLNEQVHESAQAHEEQAHGSGSESTPLVMERARLRLSQKALAQRAGITESAYIQIEKKRVRPRLVNALKIVDAINEERFKRAENNKVSVYTFDWEIPELPPRG